MGKNIAENKMKTYLGELYTENHLHNFIRYWMKAAEGDGDDWRRENDLDCLYFDGDLRADTLMSAWTPVKWVADCLNRETGKKFRKRCESGECGNGADPNHDLKLLLEDTDVWLPPKHELVLLLQEFLELAEQRCNYILLPDRNMNPDRYRIVSHKGEELWLFDEVPATLYHIFMPDTLGKYFEDFFDAVRWVEREHLEIGFTQEPIAPLHVRPLVPGMKVGEAGWLTGEREIAEALKYMIRFLKERRELLDAEELAYEVICYLKKWGLWEGGSHIYTGGQEYFYQSKRKRQGGNDTGFRNLPEVRRRECRGSLLSEKMQVYLGEDYEERSMYVDRVNPEHLFDMSLDQRLTGLLLDKVYGEEPEETAEKMIQEFNDILARHGLRYELVSRRNLSCYRI